METFWFTKIDCGFLQIQWHMVKEHLLFLKSKTRVKDTVIKPSV